MLLEIQLVWFQYSNLLYLFNAFVADIYNTHVVHYQFRNLGFLKLRTTLHEEVNYTNSVAESLYRDQQ